MRWRTCSQKTGLVQVRSKHTRLHSEHLRKTLFSGSWSSSSSSSCFFFSGLADLYGSMVHMRTVLQFPVSPLVFVSATFSKNTSLTRCLFSPPPRNPKTCLFYIPEKISTGSGSMLTFFGRKNSNSRDRGDLNKVHGNFAENICSGDLVFHRQSKGPGGCADVVAESTSFLWWYRLNQMGKSHGDLTFQRSKPKWNEDICRTNVHQFLSKDMHSIRIQHIIYMSSLKMVCFSIISFQICGLYFWKQRVHVCLNFLGTAT